ncbi:MAG: sigma-70 family RNA polymerase sigma factor [Steroidobacteraceae bacterium]
MESSVSPWQLPGLAAEALPLRRAARDDVAQLEAVMREHNQRLYRLALGLVGDQGDAEDVLQDSYLRAFQKRASFAGRSDMGAWLASIVRNQAIDHLRSRRARRSAYALEAELPYVADDLPSTIESVPATAPHGDPELGVDREQVRVALETAIATLPAPFRAVFMLREVEGLSLLQTAIYLRIPIATVKTRAHRARLLLRAELGAGFAGDSRHAFEFLRERCDRIVARVLERLARL